MRTFAMTAICLGALGMACGESSDQPDAFVIRTPDAGASGDGSTLPDGPPGPLPDASPFDAGPDGSPAPIGECDPVGQTGCDPGEKCSYLIENEDPFLARTTCVPEGTAGPGAACTLGDPGPTTGFDDCQAGLYCINGTCAEVCRLSPDSCSDGACTPYSEVFDDLDTAQGSPTVGVCSPSCNLLDNTSCPDGQGCYLILATGSEICAPVFRPETAGEQNEPCTALNNCVSGFQCLLNNPADSSTGLCAAWCDLQADGLTADGINRCRDLPQIASGDPQCVVAFVDDSGNPLDNLGICVDCAVANCGSEAAQ